MEDLFSLMIVLTLFVGGWGFIAMCEAMN